MTCTASFQRISLKRWEESYRGTVRHCCAALTKVESEKLSCCSRRVCTHCPDQLEKESCFSVFMVGRKVTSVKAEVPQHNNTPNIFPICHLLRIFVFNSLSSTSLILQTVHFLWWTVNIICRRWCLAKRGCIPVAVCLCVVKECWCSVSHAWCVILTGLPTSCVL